MEMEKILGDGKGKVIEMKESAGKICRNVDTETGKTCRNPAEPGDDYCIFCLKLKKLTDGREHCSVGR